MSWRAAANDVAGEQATVASGMRSFAAALLANTTHGVDPVISSTLDAAAIEDLRQFG